MQTNDITNDTSTENQAAQLEVRMHCPKCMKLFSVPINELNEVEPLFNCNSCQTVFSISLREALETNDNIIGQVVEPVLQEVVAAPAMNEVESVQQEVLQKPSPQHHTFAVAKSLFTCPKCGHEYAAGEEECAHCGVLFLKFAEQERKAISRPKEDSFNASKEVRQSWEDVLNNYENYDFHRQFIGAAWADRTLDYAAHKYATILEMMPADELAQKAQKEIQALTMVRFEVSTETAASTGSWAQFLNAMNTFRTNALSLRRLKITNLIMIACGVIIMMGIAMPHMRNLVGFGSAILGFILALRFYFRVI